MLSIAIYTHSDYFDILPVQLGYFNKIFNEEDKVYLFSDKLYPTCKFNNILYNGDLPYASRLLSCIQQLDTEYLLLTHENDILLRYNRDFIKDIISTMDIHGIDSVDLKYDSNTSNATPVNSTLSLVSKSYYHFNVQPTLWKRDRLISLLETFPNKTYRTIEYDDLQLHMTQHYNTRALNSNTYMQSIWYKVTPFYCYIHITSRLLLLPCKPTNNLDAFIQEEHEKMFHEYLQYSPRRLQDNIYAFNNSAVEGLMDVFIKEPSLQI